MTNLTKRAAAQVRELFQSRRPVAAWRYLEGLAMAPEGAIPAHTEMARICLAGGLSQQAREHITAAMVTEPRESPESLVALAQYCAWHGDFEGALGVLAKAKATDEDYARIYPVWSDCCRELGRFEDAVVAGRRAVQLDPSDPMGHFALAMALGKLGKYNEALQEAIETLRGAPDHLLAYAYIANLFHFAGYGADVIELLENAVAEFPRYLPLHQKLVDIYLERQEPAKALPHALTISLWDWTPRTLEIAGYCAAAAGRQGLAESALLAAIEQEPDNWISHLLLGELYLENGAVDLAEPELLKARGLNSDAWQPMVSLGILLIETNRGAEGDNLLRAAVEKAPGEPQPALRLAQRYTVTTQMPEAMIQAYRAFESSEENSPVRLEATELLQQLSTRVPAK